MTKWGDKEISEKATLHHTTKESKKESNPTSYNIRKHTTKESKKESNPTPYNIRKQIWKRKIQKQYKKHTKDN